MDLLQDMVDAGMESIIVKVASIGLNPRRHLGKTIGMLQNDFLRLVSEAFGCDLQARTLIALVYLYYRKRDSR